VGREDPGAGAAARREPRLASAADTGG
jgi:hypothetical protein